MIDRKIVFSPCRKWRYTLWRDWSSQMTNGVFFTEDPHIDFYPGRRETFVNFLMLNPSKADEKQDDATIRRCINFAKAWGFGAMCVTNLFAFMATQPDDMKAQKDPIGLDNDEWIINIARESSLLVAAWGVHGQHNGRADYVRSKLLHDLEIKCFGHTIDDTRSILCVCRTKLFLKTCEWNVASCLPVRQRKVSRLHSKQRQDDLGMQPQPPH